MTTIGEVMTGDVMTLEPYDTVDRVRDLMHIHGISCVPIVDHGGLCGIVTSTDVVEDWPPEQPLGPVMSEEVRVVPAGTSVTLAARIMREERIHHLVVGEGTSIEGVVSSWDLLDVLADIVDSGDYPVEGCER